MLAAATLGCGQASNGAAQSESCGATAGEIALVPTVTVDGLEELTNRTAGSLFVEEVIMNAQSVSIWDTQGNSQDIKGSNRFFLRYNPGAGETGLTRLWAPADARFNELTIDVAPLFLADETVREESRARGFDLSRLNQSSVVIRGMIATDAAGTRPGSEGPLAQRLCTASTGGLACEGTVPDTAPARGGLVPEVSSNVPAHDELVKVDNGTVPDTAPARDDIANSRAGFQRGTGADGRMPDRAYKPFVLVTGGSFVLGTELDPAILENGGQVVLHLDVNTLFSSERLADLAAGAASPFERVVTRGVRGDELSRSIEVQAGDVGGVPSPSPR